MRIRVQLIQNSPLHKVPTILLNINQSQYMFNLIPSLLRHRKNHQINLINNTNIFFTKHSIEALGGLPNLILYTHKAGNTNTQISPTFNIFCDNAIFNYLQKLRFKLGYKILMVSYCNWIGKKYRFGISNRALLQKLQKQPDFPHYFSKIQQRLSRSNYDKRDYYNSTYFIRSEPMRYIGKTISYFNDRNVSIIPLSRSKGNEGQLCISYLLIPNELTGQDNIDIASFIQKTQIKDKDIIQEFMKYGQIKTKDGRYYRKEQFMLKQAIKPKNILILHYDDNESLKRLYSNDILQDYLQRKNQTGLIIHIVQDIKLTYSNEFRQFMDLFGSDVKHLWYNNNCIVYENNLIQNQFHIINNSLWQQVLPSFLVNIYNNRLTYQVNQQQRIMNSLFPFYNSIFYRKMYYNILSHQTIEEIPLNQSIVCIKEQNILQSLLIKYSEQLKTLRSGQVVTKSNNNSVPEVAFLGTASGFPTTHRNTMGILVAMNKDLNILLDCGQGTYQQMVDHFSKQSLEVEMLKIQILFITHIHPDHNLGILNLISQRKKLMAQQNVKKKLFLIIPFNVFNWFIQFNKTVQDLTSSCDVIFTQCLKHRHHPEQLNAIYSYFDIHNSTMQNKPSFFNKQQKPKCEKYKIDEFEVSKKSKQLIAKELQDNSRINMEIFQKTLKQNSITIFEPVEVIHCPQSYGIVISDGQFKISYSGDTRPSPNFKEKAKNSSVMIHEATFDDRQVGLAEEALHSTVLQAIIMGKQSGSAKTVLTHFGEKIIQNPFQKQYNEQVIDYLRKNVIYSFDHLSMNLGNMSGLAEISQLMMKIQSQKQELLLSQADSPSNNAQQQ